MNKTPRIECAVLVLLMGAAPSLCAAEDGAWSAGMGVAFVQSEYRSTDDTTAPIPFIMYRRGRLSVGPYGARYSFYRRPGIDVAAVAEPRIQHVDFDDAPALDGVHQRDSTVDLGLAVRLETHGAALEVEGIADAFGVHNGEQLKVSAGADLVEGPIRVAPSIALKWQSAELIDYYYGVSADEARPGRPIYEPNDDVTVSVSLDVRYPMSYQLWAVAMMSYAKFPDAIADSPLVEGDGAGQVIVGLMYDF